MMTITNRSGSAIASWRLFVRYRRARVDRVWGARWHPAAPRVRRAGVVAPRPGRLVLRPGSERGIRVPGQRPLRPAGRLLLRHGPVPVPPSPRVMPLPAPARNGCRPARNERASAGGEGQRAAGPSAGGRDSQRAAGTVSGRPGQSAGGRGGRGRQRTTLPALMHEVHTLSRFGVPATTVRTVWMLGFQRRRVRRCECEILLPNPGCLPQTSQTEATGSLHQVGGMVSARRDHKIRPGSRRRISDLPARRRTGAIRRR